MTSGDPNTTSTTTEPHGWALVWRGLEVRLRFVFVFAAIAAGMAGWPWLRIGWELLLAHLSPLSSQAAVSADSEFFCPMDPGVVTPWPAICPICNMDLIPRKKADAVLLPDGVVSRMQLSPYRIQLAGVRTAIVREVAPPADDSKKLVQIPTTAVIDHGSEKIVYVESMPGMFDGIRVQVTQRQGDEFTVSEGLLAGQKVVVMGAYLIDAECRLNSNLATQYFGANLQSQSTPPAMPAPRSSKKGIESLSPDDRKLAQSQKICPVTDAALGSMGIPVSVQVGERKVFLCCRGCEGPLLRDPQKFLAKLPGGSTLPR